MNAVLFPWIKRPDLIAVPHDAGGWVVKDPLTLHYAYLDDTEYTILSFLDGRTSLTQLMKRIQEFCPARQLTPDDLSHFVRALAGHQLIRQTLPGDSQRLNPPNAKTSWLRLVQPLFQILRIQMPLMNPTTLLTAALPVVTRLVSPLVQRFLAIMTAAAFVLVILRFHDMAAALPTIQEFLGPQNVLLMLAIFVAVKVLHEAGHAITARYFGAECNEVGVMLMVFTPVLYTNVSDAWMLPRRERMLITAAGICVELVIASACTLLWYAAEPGLTKSLLLNTMILCSVNTVLFNGNPLLRFDGYFLLADALRIPNLAGRAVVVLQSAVLKVVTGRTVESFEWRRTRTVLLIYGILSAAYRVLLTLAILQLVRQVTEQWNIQIAGTLLTITILIGFIVLPLARFFAALFDSDAMAQYGVKTWIRIAVCGAAFSLLLFVPLPQSIVAPAFVQSNAPPLYTTLSGQIQMHRHYGDSVPADEKLVTLQNVDLLLTGTRLAGRAEELDKQLSSLIRNPATANSELIPTIRESLNSAIDERRQFETESADLEIRAADAGLFLPPTAVRERRRSELPEFWNGTPADAKNAGAWMERGTLLGYVGEPTDVVLRACVSEDDVDFIRRGQRVRFLSTSGGATSRTGTVVEVATLESHSLPEALVLSGLINGRPTENGIEPLEVTYLVTVQLSDDESSEALPLNSVGRVRIATQSASLFRRLQRYLRRTF